MGDDKSGGEIFLEHMPVLTVWYKVVILYIFQILIFILSMTFFWFISSKFLAASLIAEFTIVFCGTFPYRYMAIKIDKIRDKYIKKYGKLAGQSLWLRYESYTIPLLSSSLYFPILLINYEFIPRIIDLPSHFITNSLFPYYIAIPLSVVVLFIGLSVRTPSGGFGPDVETYLYLLYPEKGELITGGLYKYIRNPRYLSRGFYSIGLGILANNILAIGVGFVHFIVFSSLIFPEDKELHRRFGKDFLEYKKQVPALIPKIGNWIKIAKFITKKDKK